MVLGEEEIFDGPGEFVVVPILAGKPHELNIQLKPLISEIHHTQAIQRSLAVV